MDNPPSNIVTPPDFVDEPHDTVLLIDCQWADVESVALWCKTAPKAYNIYIYQDIMLDQEWLVGAINRAKIIIVNMDESAVQSIKKDLLQADNVWYYGAKFLSNPRSLGKPLDWFLNDE